MNRLFELIALEDNKIDDYINDRLSELNKVDSYEEISLLADDGNIYPNWINTNDTYLPSGYRSKGFKIDMQFIKDFILYVKSNFGKIPLDRLREKLNKDTLIKILNMYVKLYFADQNGNSYDIEKRKGIYGYGSLNSIGKSLNISELKELSVARCIELSAALNSILNFLDINSSLVLSKANDVGHAYCLVNTDEKYIIVDPNFFGLDKNGNSIPYIFEIDPHNSSISFDPSDFGDDESLVVNYSFPSQKFSTINRK